MSYAAEFQILAACIKRKIGYYQKEDFKRWRKKNLRDPDNINTMFKFFDF